jgi:two-component system NtrC family response regulator
MSRRLLLIEDDAAFAHRLAANLGAAGYDVESAPDGAAALAALKSAYFDLVVTDIRLPDLSGLEIIERIKEGREGLDPLLPVVVLTSVRDVETAVGAMRRGAADYLTKESERQEILMRIERVLEQSALLNENRYLRDQLERHDEFSEMVGDSPPMRAIKDDIAHLAGEDVPVLITGETGVGKELVARALHRTGAHPRGPFVDVNCGALPDENLLLSELFGHERGAFTGAVALRRGKFELASGGSLFLDEIGEMPLEAQAKVLKTIETLHVTRLGSSREIEARCRLIFATNKDLQAEAAAGHFRLDLFYRIHLLPIHVPPLRERREDIPALAAFFLAQFCSRHGRPPRYLSDEAMTVLRQGQWPGNVRELRNVVERLIIRARGEVITLEDLARCGVGVEAAREAAGAHVATSGAADGTPRARPEAIPGEAEPGPRQQAAALHNGVPAPLILPVGGVSLEDVERQLVVQALEASDWNQKRAAALLHISEDRMNARVRKYGLTHPSWRVNR